MAFPFDGFRFVQSLMGGVSPTHVAGRLESGDTTPNVAHTALQPGMVLAANTAGRVQAYANDDIGVFGVCMEGTDSTAAEDDLIPIMPFLPGSVFRAAADAAVTLTSHIYRTSDPKFASGPLYQLDISSATNDNFIAIDGDETDDTLDVIPVRTFFTGPFTVATAVVEAPATAFTGP